MKYITRSSLCHGQRSNDGERRSSHNDNAAWKHKHVLSRCRKTSTTFVALSRDNIRIHLSLLFRRSFFKLRWDENCDRRLCRRDFILQQPSPLFTISDAISLHFSFGTHIYPLGLWCTIEYNVLQPNGTRYLRCLLFLVSIDFNNWYHNFHLGLSGLERGTLFGSCSWYRQWFQIGYKSESTRADRFLT